MSFKVVRDAEGNAISYGPNDDSYEPGKPYVIEDMVPLLHIPSAASVADPAQKLTDFLAANPDVAALVAGYTS